MLKINIETIPHESQRYETVGDYWIDAKGTVQIRVSEMGNSKYEFLVALHELVEQALCKHKNIPFEQIDLFDIEYEKNRLPWDKTSEPGNCPKAPYYAQHQMATFIESGMANALEVSWANYCRTIEEL